MRSNNNSSTKGSHVTYYEENFLSFSHTQILAFSPIPACSFNVSFCSLSIFPLLSLEKTLFIFRGKLMCSLLLGDASYPQAMSTQSTLWIPFAWSLFRCNLHPLHKFVSKGAWPYSFLHSLPLYWNHLAELNYSQNNYWLNTIKNILMIKIIVKKMHCKKCLILNFMWYYDKLANKATTEYRRNVWH